MTRAPKYVGLNSDVVDLVILRPPLVSPSSGAVAKRILRLSERSRPISVHSGREDAVYKFWFVRAANRQEPEAREPELGGLSGRAKSDLRGGLTGGRRYRATDF
jgi:hypothetical protein